MHTTGRNEKDLKPEFNKDMEALERNQTEMKMELKNPVNQLETSRESLTSRMNETDDRTSGLKVKEEDQYQISKQYEKKTGKKNTGNV